MITRSRVGVLLLQLGSPDDPSVAAVRRYLRQFLSDPRVIELPRWLWWPILYGIVLVFRPKQSAEKYQHIWDPQTGFPLKHYTELQVRGLQERLGEKFLVGYAMRYGHPTTDETVPAMVQEGIDRLVVVPLYPQYSATTTASALDALFRTLMRQRVIPPLRIVPPFYEHAGYLEAECAIVRETVAKLDEPPEKIIFSFHGIPVRYAKAGDPYPQQVEQTVRLLAQRLGLAPEQYVLAYQSRFGREPWLQPYLDETLTTLAQKGVRRVLVVTPGFTTDCLETIDEIGREMRDLFLQAGGTQLFRCPCLNDHPTWLDALRTIVLEESVGWI
jgi:ferrochelatase